MLAHTYGMIQQAISRLRMVAIGLVIVAVSACGAGPPSEQSRTSRAATQWPDTYPYHQGRPEGGEEQILSEKRAAAAEMRNLGRSAEMEDALRDLRRGIREERAETLSTFPELYGRDGWQQPYRP